MESLRTSVVAILVKFRVASSTLNNTANGFGLPLKISIDISKNNSKTEREEIMNNRCSVV